MNYIYFDNAATSWPKPQCVENAVKTFFKTCYGSPNRTLGDRSSVERLRDKILTYFNANNGSYSVAFVPSATIAMNIALKYVYENDYQIITTNYEHHCVYRVLNEYKMKYKCVDCIGQKNEIKLKPIFELPSNYDGALVINHGSNVIGSIANISSVKSDLTKSFMVVDVSQTAGIEEIDVIENDIDILIGGGHKHLLGLPGIGYIIYRKKLKPSPLYYGGTGHKSNEMVQPRDWPDILEVGTSNLPAILALEAGIDYCDKQYRSCVREYTDGLVEYFIKGVQKVKNIRLFHGIKGERTGVVSFVIPNVDPTFIIAPYLLKHGIMVRSGLHCAPLVHKAIGTFPDGTVRVSFSKENTKAEIDVLVNCLKKLCDELC